MKIFRRVLLIIFIVLLVIFSILFFIGFGYYSNVLKEKPLVNRVTEITSKDHFVKFNEMSKDYINAVIAIEDHRFYDHGPVDFIAILRAIFTNIKDNEFEQGGSTITQQVSKNILFTQERTLARKLGEVFGAFDLEKNYTKNEIFELYVNTCYFGDGYYGIYDASMGYFNKEPKDLTLYEATILAGVPNAPSIYSPTVNPELCKQRQKQVLNSMVNYGYISENDRSDVLNESSK
ncbi:MAG: transglycosylase domain-containing protein [Clostridia bacterium]|nr:transglycosylase domain-containing protein [Clostridia bacterium]